VQTANLWAVRCRYQARTITVDMQTSMTGTGQRMSPKLRVEGYLLESFLISSLRSEGTGAKRF